MRKFLFKRSISVHTLLVVLLLMIAAPSLAQIYVGGQITADITYSPNNNPYIVTQDLIVNEGVTLTILPGVILDFYYGTGIISNGTLIARGKPNSRIIFRPKNPLPYPGQWDGITFNASTTLLEGGEYISGPVITNAHISKASYGITANDFSSILVDSCIIERSNFGVFIGEASNNIIRRNTINNCDFAIFIAGSYHNPSNQIHNNLISGSSDIGIFLNNFPDASTNQLISNNYINHCSIGIQLGNYGLHGSGKHTITNNILTKNGTALLLFHDSSQVKNNYFTADTSALVCYGSSHNQILENYFAGNAEIGISLQSSSSLNTISYNSFSYNNMGLKLIGSGGDDSPILNNIIYNSFFKNSLSGSVLFESAPQGPIQFNNLKENGNYSSFVNNSNELLHAEYCYWGVNTLLGVDSIIYDKNDDAAKGEVLYKPVFVDELTIAPILPPQNVSKQWIKNKVYVTYNKAGAIDAAGYYMHFGESNAIGFTHKIPNGNNLSFWYTGSSLYDTIAVTTIDNQADGFWDQPQGHESCYAFAKIIPYAGSDTSICFNSSFSITHANAINFSSTTWRTSGDGVFSDKHSLNTVYTPGVADFLLGYTFLHLTGYNLTDSATDSMKITYHDEPVIQLASDTTLFVELSFTFGDIEILGYDHIKWETSGDGTFDYDTIVSPVYTPGPNDLTSKQVILTCSAFSACGSTSKSITVNIDKGFSISGTVQADDIALSACKVIMYTNYTGKIAESKSTVTLQDGSFYASGLPGGNYYLYAIPDYQAQALGYMPTYYHNSLYWDNAYHLPLAQNVYDVDIKLTKRSVALPAGSGSIKGFVTPLGSVANKCTDVTIFLFDKNAKNSFSYYRIENGNNFEFENLPFGEYKLVGEKTGFTSFSSEVLNISPNNPIIDNVEIFCNQSGLSFKAIPVPNPTTLQLNIFPNPFSNEVIIEGTEPITNPLVRLYNYQGILVTNFSINHSADNRLVLSLIKQPSGIYFIEIYDGNECKFSKKIIKL